MIRAVLLKIAARNVRAHWRKSRAAILILTAGYVAVALFSGFINEVAGIYGEAAANRMMLGDVLIEQAQPSDQASRDAEHPRIRPETQAWIDRYLSSSAEEVEARVRFLDLFGRITNGRASMIFAGTGFDPEEGARMRRGWAWNTYSGKPLQLTAPDSVIVGRSLGEILDCVADSTEPRLSSWDGYAKVDRPFRCVTDQMRLSVTSVNGQANALSLTTTGLIDAGNAETNSRYLEVPLAVAQRLLDTQDVSRYSVRLRAGISAAGFAARMSAAAHAAGLNLEILRRQEHRMGEALMSAIRWLSFVRNFIACIVLGVSFLSVFNVFGQIIQERTREIGTLRSLGFRVGDIVRLFAAEALCLSLLSCALGAVAAIVITFVINHAGLRFDSGILSEPGPFGLKLAPLQLLATVALFLVIAVTAAFLPACRAARSRIVDCLRNP